MIQCVTLYVANILACIRDEYRKVWMWPLGVCRKCEEKPQCATKPWHTFASLWIKKIIGWYDKFRSFVMQHVIPFCLGLWRVCSCISSVISYCSPKICRYQLMCNVVVMTTRRALFLLVIIYCKCTWASYHIHLYKVFPYVHKRLSRLHHSFLIQWSSLLMHNKYMHLFMLCFNIKCDTL